MISSSVTRSSAIEASYHDGSRYNEEEDDGCEHTMSRDYAVVLCYSREAITHAYEVLAASRSGLSLDCLPLYCIVSKLRATRLGSRNVFLEKSHVPSPTTRVSDE